MSREFSPFFTSTLSPLLNSGGHGSRKDDFHSGTQISWVLNLVAVPKDNVLPSSRVLESLFRNLKYGVAFLDNITSSLPSRGCCRCNRRRETSASVCRQAAPLTSSCKNLGVIFLQVLQRRNLNLRSRFRKPSGSQATIMNRQGLIKKARFVKPSADRHISIARLDNVSFGIGNARRRLSACPLTVRRCTALRIIRGSLIRRSRNRRLRRRS